LFISVSALTDTYILSLSDTSPIPTPASYLFIFHSSFLLADFGIGDDELSY